MAGCSPFSIGRTSAPRPFQRVPRAPTRPRRQLVQFGNWAIDIATNGIAIWPLMGPARRESHSRPLARFPRGGNSPESVISALVHHVPNTTNQLLAHHKTVVLKQGRPTRSGPPNAVASCCPRFSPCPTRDYCRTAPQHHRESILMASDQLYLCLSLQIRPGSLPVSAYQAQQGPCPLWRAMDPHRVSESDVHFETPS